MKKSSIYTINQLKPMLFQIPDIVTAIQQKRFSAVNTLIQWMEEVEQKLKDLNYSQCAEVAGLRAQLIEQKYALNVRPNERKKKQIKKALEVISPLQDNVSSVVLPLEDKVKQARALLSQILSVANTMELLPPLNSNDFNGYIHTVLAILESQEQLKNGMVNVKSLVGNADCLQLIAEEIQMG